jgi:MurNAc alpha-1-phosphate uridylyltransferase
MKAMILAAGRGERLQPITNYLPKPLIPVAGQPLIVHHLLKLAAIGIRDIVINLFYRAEQIQQALGDGSRYGVHITYSVEPVMLNTGGGIVHALTWLGDEPFLLLSADIFTDYPLQQLCKPILNSAHLVMVDNPNYHPEGDFALQNGLLAHSAVGRLTYANIGIYHPQLFLNASREPFPLAQLLKAAIAQGCISGEYYTGKWHNIGTIADWQALQGSISNQSTSYS